MPDEVDARAADAPLFVSVSELARLKGVSKQWVARRVEQFEKEHGLETKPGPRGAKLVNRAAYDRLANEIEDPAKVQAAETARAFREPQGDELPLAHPPATLTQSSDRARYDAELKKLDLAERQRKLIARPDLDRAIPLVADAVISTVNRLPSRTPEIMAAALKEGEVAVRTLLKNIAFEQLTAIAKALRDLESVGLAEEAQGPITVDLPEGDGAP